MRGDVPVVKGTAVGRSYVQMTRDGPAEQYDLAFLYQYSDTPTTVFDDITDSSSDNYNLASANAAVNYIRIPDDSARFTLFKGDDVIAVGRTGNMLRYYSPTLVALSPTGAAFTAPYDIIRISVFVEVGVPGVTPDTLVFLTAVKRTGSLCSMGTPSPAPFKTTLNGFYVEVYYKA